MTALHAMIWFWLGLGAGWYCRRLWWFWRNQALVRKLGAVVQRMDKLHELGDVEGMTQEAKKYLDGIASSD
jgi:hypothetical protein